MRLLGHRWPKQIEAGEPLPEWADPDGIIPLSDGSDERTLLDRVRERIAADFAEARVDAIEQEFRQIMGRSLADWLARDFFTRHVSQCKRRPIAWRNNIRKEPVRCAASEEPGRMVKHCPRPGAPAHWSSSGPAFEHRVASLPGLCHGRQLRDATALPILREQRYG